MNIDKDKDENQTHFQSVHFNNKKIPKIQFTNMFSYVIDVLRGDKSDLDKIKALIVLEQDYTITQDKMRLFSLFKVLSDCFNQNESVCSALLKGQILMTSTTIIIILNAKSSYSSLFHNFINNILIEHLKNTSNQTNLYLRQISCLCLEELEIEYPGIMFGLMGQRTLEVVDNKKIANGSVIEDMRSVKSSMSYARRSCFSVKEKSCVKNYEYKKMELANEGLYSLIDEERYYVFQYYLLLYTRILNHVIRLYIENYKAVSSLSVSPISKDNSNSQFTIKVNDEDLKELNNDLYKNIDTNQISIDNSPSQLIGLNNNNDNSLNPFAKLNLQNANIAIEQNTLLHINHSEYQNYCDLYEKAITNYYTLQSNTQISESDRPTELSHSYHTELLSYINKSLSYIIHLLPKTSEYIKVKVWEMISYIISNIDINQIALLPHFNYFHLNSSSPVLTLVIIPIISNFKSTLKSNFILKLVIKLCLLINDIRLNEAMRILSIRWLLSLRNSFTFNFNLYLKTISYYLSPSPFDSLEIRNEKIKSLFIFFQHNSKGSEFIINSLSLYDNYKYYPIFSKHIRSLFKIYLVLLIRFPYKNVIKLLGTRIKNNLKEVPRLLPNVINLLRNIKELSSYKTLLNRDESNDNQLNQMSFEDIYKCLLEDMAFFIANYNSHSRLNNYFELFIELSKENSIDPSNLIKALKNLYSAIQDLRNWKSEKNILEVCRYLLEYHSLDTIKKNNIQSLLNDIKTKSFDYGIREQAKLYYELAENVEKPLLVKFIKAQSHQHKEINVNYNYCDYEDSLVQLLLLEQSKEERLEAYLDDRGTAIYNCGSDPNMLFQSEYKTNNTKDNIIINEFNDEVPFDKLNDYSKNEINELVDKFICPDDIMRLFVSNDKIDATKDALIPKENIFNADSNKILSQGNNDKEAIKIDITDINCIQSHYSQMIAQTCFYIKLPLNISLQNKALSNSQIKKMYSICLCFGYVSHLEIKSKIILPYLEMITNCESNNDTSFPYFYKNYLIVYPKLPIPSEIKTRAIFYDELGQCCSGFLRPVHILFEDYFLPITVPQIFEQHQQEFKLSLFKVLWKQFKTPTSQYINTTRLLEFTKDIMLSKVNKKLFPFLLNPSYENQVYIMKNPFVNMIEKNDNESESIITKLTFNEQTGEFTKLSYDFIMDNYLEMNEDKVVNKNNNDTSSLNGKYILATAIIFLPAHYHILFKIKISDYSSIIEIRNDCKEILEYLDDYFDSWENNNKPIYFRNKIK